MALKKSRLKDKIVNVLKECQKENNNSNDSLQLLADRLSSAIIEEIRELEIVYTNGLTAPNGVVTGKINATIK